MSRQVSTKDFIGLKAVSASKGKKIGKVRNAVFHPSERRCLGFIIKRPDAALMFHRKDLFVSLDGFHMADGELVVHDDDPTATDRGAVKALGVVWDRCVIWVGMPLMTKSGEFLGYVSSVSFDQMTGEVGDVTAESGAASDALLGKRVVPGGFVKGFRMGQGMALAPVGQAGGSEEEMPKGAIMVADEALQITAEGGAAAAAGKATAIASHKAKKTVVRAKKVVGEQTEKARPAAEKAAKKAGEAVEAGSFAVGKQLGKASGMFAAFKEEYNKAVHDEDE
ncbi:MAG: PRC-barrel domain protein [Coriobacteriaceae bacterium]|jgi:uncharacterized protein YrrD|nr:PRC-barrel domain protein [Coriobacteriaceae bacterium]